MKLTPIWVYLVAGILVGDAMILAVWHIDGYFGYVAAIAMAVVAAGLATWLDDRKQAALDRYIEQIRLGLTATSESGDSIIFVDHAGDTMACESYKGVTFFRTWRDTDGDRQPGDVRMNSDTIQRLIDYLDKQGAR